MGNTGSSPRSSMHGGRRRNDGDGHHSAEDDSTSRLPPFPGSALVDAALACGNIEDSSSFDDSKIRNRNRNGCSAKSIAAQLLSRAELCVMSPQNSDGDGESLSEDDGNNFFDDEYEEFGQSNNNNSRKNSTKNSVDQSSKMKNTTTSKVQPDNNSQNTSSTTTSTSTSTAGGLLAKSLASEVNKNTNPNMMTPAAMVKREKGLLKAQKKARQHHLNSMNNNSNNTNNIGGRPIGSPGEGVGQPSVLGSIAHALTGNYNGPLTGLSISEQGRDSSKVIPPNSLSEHRAAQLEQGQRASGRRSGRNSPSSLAGGPSSSGKHTVTIGLSLSRRSSALGHPDTVTRQTAFDFNELQDREYKYVSSTDSSGWRAGGGERGGAGRSTTNGGAANGGDNFFGGDSDDNEYVTKTDYNGNTSAKNSNNDSSDTNPSTPNGQDNHKVAAPDTVHIPIIQIDCETPQAVDAIISALARGEIFIPHMAIIPEALSVNGVSPPDLVVRFGTERNDDLPPDEWPNWCLEFMHNQLYEYFLGMGARWTKRPFSITLAKKVRWKTVKHMNRYFAHAERVIDAWREKGPQYLDPQLAFIEGGATPEEVARPHGIYLLRNGIPTNYFAPNFDPPYTTKMTRSLLFNVLGKSWDKKRREWTSTPIPKLITPSMLVTAMCGCTDNTASSGFMASEATVVTGPPDRSTMVPDDAAIHSLTPRNHKSPSPQKQQQKKKKERKNTPANLLDTTMPSDASDNVQLTPLSKNEMYRLRTEKATAMNRLQQQQQQMLLDNNGDEIRKPQEPSFSNTNSTPFVSETDQNMMVNNGNDRLEGRLELSTSSSSASFFSKEHSIPDSDGDEIQKPQESSFSTTNSTPFVSETDQNMMLNNGNDRLEGRLELSISSSSASFFDNSDGGIPSPPHAELLTAHRETENVAAAATKKEFERKQTNALQPLEGGVTQEKEQRQKQQPEEQEESNDENSGDSKNHHDHDFERGGINKKLQKIKNAVAGKKKKKDAAAVARMASDEDWLNDLVSKVLCLESFNPAVFC